MMSGLRGLPKHRQSARESILAPTAARFLQTSSTALMVPWYGFASIRYGFTSVVRANPFQESSTGFKTDESPGTSFPIGPCIGFRAVFPLTS